MITKLVVTGTIPDHLDGRYLRNGPNPIAEIGPEIYHWFVGDGMVHGVRLRDGKVQVIPQSLGSAAHRDRLTGQRRQWQARRSTAV